MLFARLPSQPGCSTIFTEFFKHGGRMHSNSCSPRAMELRGMQTSVKRKFRPMLRQLKIQECGLHAFRHANASLMDGLAVPMKVRQQRLGHSDSRLTMDVYTHMASADDERIAEQLGEILDAVGQNAIEITKGKGPASEPL